ncbi:DegV family protein [Desulforegula conservatrix]|uniref:DegV family protein n=1 Tax=Desulforegula conservatrix TaxID=153026 RepID=UPI00040DDA9B|nr:DegV family protein [Desulforegula conservatrix]
MAQKIGIVTDSTADFPDGVIGRLGLNVIPVHVIVDGISYLDGHTISNDEVKSYLLENRDVSTSPPTPAEYADHFERLLGKFDILLSFHISDALSGCYKSARSALNLMDSKDADKIKLFDTGTVSFGQGQYICRAIDLIREYKSINGLDKRMSGFLEKSVVNFTVDNLAWLRKGGRVSAMSAIVGDMFDIKPIIAMKNGRLVPVDRKRGKKNTFKAMAEYASKTREGEAGGFDLWVGHCNALDDAAYLAGKLAGALNYPINDIIILEIGPTITAHTGPGSVGWSMMPRL